MNKKITVKNDRGRILYCILPGEGELQSHIRKFLFGKEVPDGGYSALLYEDRIDIIDCIAYDRVTSFDILSIEDTDSDLCSEWVEV